MIISNVDGLTKGSHKLIEVKCDYCNEIREIQYKLHNNSLGLTGKFSCGSKYCRKLKTKESNLIKYGVDNVSKLHTVKESKKQTTLSNYGVENPFQSDEIKSAIKIANKEKYGYEYTAQTELVKDKIKETNIFKYGVENPFQYEVFKDKIKETNLIKYGVTYSSQADEIKNKMKESNLIKYGVTYSAQSKKVKDKIKETNIFKYGVENTFQYQPFKDKVKEDNLVKYGVEYYTQTTECRKKFFSSLSYKKYNGLVYQTSYELNFLEFCFENNIVVTDEVPRIDYSFEGKIHYYFPDFYIPEKKLIIEIKSYYWMEKLKQKNIAKREHTLQKGYNYILIMDKNYLEFLNFITNYGFYI